MNSVNGYSMSDFEVARIGINSFISGVKQMIFAIIMNHPRGFNAFAVPFIQVIGPFKNSRCRILFPAYTIIGFEPVYFYILVKIFGGRSIHYKFTVHIQYKRIVPVGIIKKIPGSDYRFIKVFRWCVEEFFFAG